jgi:eukaryotic-like serine/threonine-protein kinase
VAEEVRGGELIDGRFRLLYRIGEGGMGVVWAARHERIDRDVALKLLSPELAPSAEVRRRFVTEARAAGRLRHPNIVDVVDTGETSDGTLFIVFELLQGESLEERVFTMGWLGRRASTVIAIEICRALEAAHGAGIIHRDLKPGNVFLHRTGTGVTVVKVLDFGISKLTTEDLSLTTAGAVMGTPQYMSPEQARGEAGIDARSDVWSVGVLLFEMLAGRGPFEAPTHAATIERIIWEEPSPLYAAGRDIPASLVAIVDKCLAKDRAHRWQSARELRFALEDAERGMVDSGTDLLKIGRVSYASIPERPSAAPDPAYLPDGPPVTGRPTALSQPVRLSAVPEGRSHRRRLLSRRMGAVAAVGLVVTLGGLTIGRLTKSGMVPDVAVNAAADPPATPLTTLDVLPAVPAVATPAPPPIASVVPLNAAASDSASPKELAPVVGSKGRPPHVPRAKAPPSASAPVPGVVTKVDNAGF